MGLDLDLYRFNDGKIPVTYEEGEFHGNPLGSYNDQKMLNDTFSLHWDHTGWATFAPKEKW